MQLPEGMTMEDGELVFSDDVYVAAIARAIRDHELDDMLGLLDRLRRQNPTRAHEVLQTIQVGLRIAGERS